MISLNWHGMRDEIGSLMARYAELPRHIAKKHLNAAMKRALKPGVPILRRNTPPVGTTRGRKKAGARRTSGALRKAATSKSKYIGRNADGRVFGVLGYRAGFESRKAIWQEFGTSNGVKPKLMVQKTIDEFGPQVNSFLVSEMKSALEKAAKELASGMNPGWKG